MKSLIAVLVLALSVSSAWSSDGGDITVQVSVDQTIAIVVQQTFNASTAFTSGANFFAKKIQNEIQEYNQTGEASAFLAERIALVQEVNPTLSEQEAVDVLLAATNEILN